MLLNSGGIDDAASSPLAPLPPPAPKRSEKDEVTGTDANSKANMSRLRAANHRHARHPLPSATIFLTDSDAALTAVQELRLCPICDTSRRLLSVLASFLADALSVESRPAPKPPIGCLGCILRLSIPSLHQSSQTLLASSHDAYI